MACRGSSISSHMHSKFKLNTAEKRDINLTNSSYLTNHVSNISWAHLPDDLLLIIFGHLQNTDYYEGFLDLYNIYKCLAVCRSWRFVAKQLWQKNILPTTPWLLFHIGINTVVFETNLFKCHEGEYTNNKDPFFVCSLPNIGPRPSYMGPSFNWNIPSPLPPCLDFNMKTSYATNDGWLLLGSGVDLQLYLHNPITGVFLKLPPISVHVFTLNYTKFVSFGGVPTDLSCIICVKFTRDREFIRSSESVFENKSVLAFCKPASSLSWDVILNDNVEDMIFYHGKFYTIDNNGALFVYNDDVINGNTMVSLQWKEIKIAEAVSSKDDEEWYRFFYLVESISGELLMIKRIFRTNMPITRSFRIFKLNSWRNNYRDYYCWEEMSNLEENESLFLGWNECIPLCINNNEPNTYKPNCIYFFDQLFCGQELNIPNPEYWMDLSAEGLLSAHGMYDLTNRTNHYKYLETENGGLHRQLFTPYRLANV